MRVGTCKLIEIFKYHKQVTHRFIYELGKYSLWAEILNSKAGFSVTIPSP